MDHIFMAGASGTIPGHERERTFGNRPNGIYVARFRNVKTKHPDFLRGYGCQGGAGRRAGDAARCRAIGAEWKRRSSRSGAMELLARRMGRVPAPARQLVSLDPEVKDAWGIPALRIHCTWGPNELRDGRGHAGRLRRDPRRRRRHQHRRFNDKSDPGLCIHEMGTARMGRDRRRRCSTSGTRSGTPRTCSCTDGACMTSSGCQNPSITYMALTARARCAAVELMKRREL